MTASDPGGPARGVQSSDQHRAAEKDTLRAAALRRRAERGADPHADAARTARALDACRDHRAVACYASIGAEPGTWPLVEALRAEGVRVLLPVLAGRRTPAWAWYAGPDALRPGFRGILEPVGSVLGPDALRDASFVWASALLVARDGVRLGTGGGWYDRALASAAPGTVVGVLVSDDDVVSTLPRDPWDRPVEIIVTPTRTLAAGAPAE